MILIQAKHQQKTVETYQPPLNALPVFIITEQKVLGSIVYMKQRSLLSLHLARTLDSPFEMWFQYRLRFRPIWVSVLDLNHISCFGHTLIS